MENGWRNYVSVCTCPEGEFCNKACYEYIITETDKHEHQDGI